VSPEAEKSFFTTEHAKITEKYFLIQSVSSVAFWVLRGEISVVTKPAKVFSGKLLTSQVGIGHN
jgi:hypothetical protein